MKKQLEYSFGVGEIGKVLEGDLERKASIDELNFNDAQGKQSLIVIPKIIGVYQKNKFIPEMINEMMSLIEKIGIFSRSNKLEDIHPELICIGYDPTQLNDSILTKILDDKDPYRRVKITEHYQLPDFSNKKKIDKARVINTYVTKEISRDSKLAVMGNIKNYFELLKRDYGLSREELAGYLATKVFFDKLSNKLPLVENISEVEFKKIMKDVSGEDI